MFFMPWNRLRVVPLFETVKDLREAGSVIRKLLSIDWYREHIIKNHNGHQEVIRKPRKKLISVLEKLSLRSTKLIKSWIGNGWIF